MATRAALIVRRECALLARVRLPFAVAVTTLVLAALAPLPVAAASTETTAATEPVREEPPHRPNAVQADLGLGVVGLAYERVLERHLALQLEAHIFGTWFGPIFDEPNLSGLGGQIRPSVFVTGDAPRGVYVAPFLRVDRVTAKSNGAEGRAWGYSAGGWVGYSFLFLADRLNLRIGAGVQVLAYDVSVQGKSVAFKSLFPALDLVVGYCF